MIQCEIVLNRRTLLAAMPALSVRTHKRMTAKLALTFDYHPHVVDARNIMSAAGIFTATYYAWHPNIVSGQPTGDQVSLTDLTLMKQLGWEIGAYTQDNMVNKHGNNRNDAFTFLHDLDEGMNSKGFKVATIAPNQRAWNASLANLARGRFKGVRVAGAPAAQGLPVQDPLFVNGGGAASWGSPGSNGFSGSVTPNDILTRVDAIPSGCAGIEVIHKIGPVADGLTLTTPDFTTVIGGLASRVASGAIELVTMEQLCLI